MIHLSAFADEISPEPIEQLDVLTEHNIRHVEFRSIFGTNVLDLSDAQHDVLPRPPCATGASPSARSDRRSARSRRPTSPSSPTSPGSILALDLADFYACTPDPRSSATTSPTGIRSRSPIPRPRSFKRMAVQGRDRGESEGVTLFLENEKGIYGDTAARVSEILESVDSPALGPRFRPGQLPRSRPADRARPGNSSAGRTGSYPRQGFRRQGPQAPRRRPAKGQGQIPRIIAEAVSDGYTGFCTLEPHLVVAEQMYGFTGPVRFGDAARALQEALDRKGIAYG